MKKKKVTLVIEASSTGFGIFGEDFPVTAYGETVEAAKKDLESAIADVLEHYKMERQKPDPALNEGNLEFSFKYDIASIFNHFGMLDATGLAKKMPEDRRSYLDEILDDLFGLRPPSWVLVPQIVETMLHVVATGHVVLIGRGATVVTARLPNVLHVRLIASLAVRIGRVQARHHLTIEEATRLVEKEDRGRRRYARANFHVRLENELLYHLVVNTDHLAFADAAAVIAEAATRYFRRSSGSPRSS